MSALAAVEAPPIRAAVYCRISADATGDAAGVDRQETICRDLAAAHGWDVDAVIIDNDVSAYSGVTRPGYERLLTMVEQREVDAIAVYHADRLYRRPRDLERLVDVIERADVRVETAMSGAIDLSTATGRMVAKMLAVVNEHESARIGERVSAAHRSNAQQGRAHGGGRPFGYERGGAGELVVKPDEAELIVEAAHRILRGASLNSIVVDWNERGIPSVRGNRWRPNSLSKLLRSGRIAGLREQAGEVIGEGTWEPILDRPTWERLRARITHAPIGRRPKKNLLAGMVLCGVCGVPMTARSAGTGKYGQRAYACDRVTRAGCGSNSVKAEAVEAIVVDHVLGSLERVNLNEARTRYTAEASSTLVAEITEDQQMLDDLAADMGARRLSRSEWLSARGPIEERMTENRRRLEQVAVLGSFDDAVFDGLDDAGFKALDFDDKRAVIGLLVDRITVAKGKPGRTFDPSRVKVVPAGARKQP